MPSRNEHVVTRVRTRLERLVFRLMDRRHAVQLLPEPYAKALQLKHEGLTDEDIADELGIDAESVQPFIRLAEAKLANLLSDQMIALTDRDERTDVEPRFDLDRTRAGSDE